MRPQSSAAHASLSQHDTYRDLIVAAERDGVYRYVVAAVLECAGAVLLLQRPPGDFMGGIFELPSGKVEPRETLDTALRREVKEETGLTLAAIDRYLGHFDYLSGGGWPTRQFTFAATAEPLQPITLSEHMRYAWLRQDEIAQFTVSDSVRSVLAEYWRQPELQGVPRCGAERPPPYEPRWASGISAK